MKYKPKIENKTFANKTKKIILFSKIIIYYFHWPNSWNADANVFVLLSELNLCWAKGYCAKTNIRICNVDGIRVYRLLSILHCFLIRIYHNCIWFRLYIRNVIEKNRAFLFMVSSMQNCKSANLHSCHNL